MRQAELAAHRVDRLDEGVGALEPLAAQLGQALADEQLDRFGHRDVARGTPGEVYNVCSGEGVRIGDLAAEVLAVAGSTATLKVDPALQRAVDVPALVGSNAKLRAATGWAPKKSRTDIIQDLLNAAS